MILSISKRRGKVVTRSIGQSIDSLGSVSFRSARIRRRVLELSHQAAVPHIGSSLSVVDILTAIMANELWRPDNPETELVLSKGHAAVALYSALNEFGYIDDDLLANFAKPGSVLEEHPNHLVPGVSTPSGSLGHGLPFGAGFVLGGKRKGSRHRAFVIMSDGECNEGTVWEAAILAGAKKLGGLVAVVDSNGWQATGRTTETYGDISIGDVFRSFGWQSIEADGHDLGDLLEALSIAEKNREQPVCIIANTVKGKGVSFMEDDNNWHYRTLSEDELALAVNDLTGLDA